MGFFAYLLEPELNPMLLLEDIFNDINMIKNIKYYHIIDNIKISYIKENDVEKINIDFYINIYETYEERLLRNNLIFQLNFPVKDFINKSLSENLWNKCYIKSKELLLIQNTNYIKKFLNLNDNDTIPSQYQYLLEINDHFN